MLKATVELMVVVVGAVPPPPATPEMLAGLRNWRRRSSTDRGVAAGSK